MNKTVRLVDYLAGHWRALTHPLWSKHVNGPAIRRRSPARLAPAPAHEPARPRRRGRHLDPSPEFPRNRPRPTEPRDAPASRRAARSAAARQECASRLRRIRADLSRARSERPGAPRRPPGGGVGAQGPRAISGSRHQSALGTRRVEWSRFGAAPRYRRGPPEAAGQRPAAVAAPGRTGAAHRQLWRMAGASSRAPAPPGGHHRGSGAHRACG